MPLTLNVGLSKKMGLPDYGSLGVSCHVEVEVDSALLTHDPGAFQQKVKQVFTACNQAVKDELAWQRQHAQGDYGEDDLGGNGSYQPPPGPAAPNGSARATNKQIGYARQLAGKIPNLRVDGLESLTDALLDKPLAELSAPEASHLIDTLKQLIGGKLSLAELYEGASP